MEKKIKEIATRIVKGVTITDEDLNEFIVYLFNQRLKRDPSTHELVTVRNLIEVGVLNIYQAARNILLNENIYILTVVNGLGNILRVDVYE